MDGPRPDMLTRTPDNQPVRLDRMVLVIKERCDALRVSVIAYYANGIDRLPERFTCVILISTMKKEPTTRSAWPPSVAVQYSWKSSNPKGSPVLPPIPKERSYT